MKNAISITFKKEAFDFIHNYKSWVAVAVVVVLPYFFTYFNREFEGIFFICFILMAVCQYLYDSYLTDTTTKGMVFFRNFGASFTHIIMVKTLYAVLLSVIILLLDFPYTMVYFTLIDILWFLPLAVGIAAIMQLAMVFARGAEIASALITTCIIFAGVFLLLTLSTLMRAGVTMAAAIILVRLAYCSFNSLRYRTQL